MDLQLSNGTAVITGGEGGIGRATAAILGVEGARVVIADQDRARIEAAGASFGSDVHPLVVDVADAAPIERFRDDAPARLGRVDCLINAAGITGATGPFDEIDDAGRHDTIRTMLPGTVRVVRARTGHMAACGAGRVVLVNSVGPAFIATPMADATREDRARKIGTGVDGGSVATI